ncbi:MAG: HTH domain-containing protein [Halorientalis sp.]
MTEDVRLELYVRSLAPLQGLAQQRAVIDELERLVSEDVIDGYDVHVWGDAVAVDSALAETDTGRGIQTRIAAFQQWALSENVSVQPFFETKTRSSRITGEDRTVVTLPTLTVAEYEGAELVGMAPHRDDGEVVAAHEYVDAIGTRRTHTYVEEPTAERTVSAPSDD